MRLFRDTCFVVTGLLCLGSFALAQPGQRSRDDDHRPGRPPGPPSAGEIFDRMDADGDGKVTKSEFEKSHQEMMERMGHPPFMPEHRPGQGDRSKARRPEHRGPEHAGHPGPPQMGHKPPFGNARRPGQARGMAPRGPHHWGPNQHSRHWGTHQRGMNQRGMNRRPSVRGPGRFGPGQSGFSRGHRGMRGMQSQRFGWRRGDHSRDGHEYGHFGKERGHGHGHGHGFKGRDRDDREHGEHEHRKSHDERGEGSSRMEAVRQHMEEMHQHMAERMQQFRKEGKSPEDMRKLMEQMRERMQQRPGSEGDRDRQPRGPEGVRPPMGRGPGRPAERRPEGVRPEEGVRSRSQEPSRTDRAETMKDATEADPSQPSVPVNTESAGEQATETLTQTDEDNTVAESEAEESPNAEKPESSKKKSKSKKNKNENTDNNSAELAPELPLTEDKEEPAAANPAITGSVEALPASELQESLPAIDTNTSKLEVQEGPVDTLKVEDSE